MHGALVGLRAPPRSVRHWREQATFRERPVREQAHAGHAGSSRARAAANAAQAWRGVDAPVGGELYQGVVLRARAPPRYRHTSRRQARPRNAPGRTGARSHRRRSTPRSARRGPAAGGRAAAPAPARSVPAPPHRGRSPGTKAKPSQRAPPRAHGQRRDRPVERRTHIGQLRLVAMQPDHLIERPVLLVGDIEQLKHRLCHARLRGLGLPEPLQAVARVVACALQKQITRRLYRKHRNERAIHQAADEIGRVGGVDALIGNAAGSSLEREAAGERGEAAEDALLGRAQQLVAPGRRRHAAHRAGHPAWHGPRTSAQPEAVIQARAAVLQSPRARARVARRQLQRQREYHRGAGRSRPPAKRVCRTQIRKRLLPRRLRPLRARSATARIAGRLRVRRSPGLRCRGEGA